MPIDLKWVRQNPKQVEEWQRLRHLLRAPDVCPTIEVLVQDELCRKYLFEIQQYKKHIKQIQQQLRPRNCSGDRNNESISEQQQQQRNTLLQDKKKLEDQIQHVETLLSKSTRETQRALWKLGSPIIERKEQTACVAVEEVSSSLTVLEGNVSLSGLGMAIQHSWKQYTMEYFATVYPSIELERGITVKDATATSSNNSFIDPDSAHAIWGCSNLIGLVDSPQTDDNRMTRCPLCNISSEQQQKHPAEVMLPTWIRLLKQHIANKSIWGDKQLPVFASIWSNNDSTNDKTANKIWLTPRRNNDDNTTLSLRSQFSLELIAFTASSLVDAREIQNDMVSELKEYYSSLLIFDDTTSSTSSDRVIIHHVDPPDLNIHEWNRIEIHAKTMSSVCQTVCLGWVSCWGDAASRTLDMAFAGGGIRTTRKQAKKKSSSQVCKEYVYVVQASVVDPSTWEKFILLNSKESDLQKTVGIPPTMKPPPCLASNLATKTTKSEHTGEVAWIPVQDLTLTLGKKNKKSGSVFGPKRETSRSGRRGGDNLDKPKFPPIWTLEGASNGVENEALSCPFEFLF
jgi:hypothetical protein